MVEEKHRTPRRLPFYGKPSLRKSISTSSKIKGVSPLHFIARKLVNHILLTIAYSCPINGVRITLHRWRGVNIGRNVFIGLHVVLDRAYPDYVTLEDGVMLAGGNHLLCHSRAPEHFRGKLLSYVAPIRLKKNAWIAVNAIILPNVTVGEGSVVTAGSVVSADVPPDCIVRGNPAEVIKKFK